MTEAVLATADRGLLRPVPLLGKIGTLLAVPVAIIVIWQIVALVADTSALPGPVPAFAEIGDLLTSRRYLTNLAITAQTLLVAFVLAVIVGGVAGFALGLAPFWLRAVGPILQAIYSIPKVTLFPLFLVFLGLGIVSRTSFAFVHGVFPMMIIVMGATANLRMTEIWLKLGASLDMTRWQLTRSVLIPAVLPSFLTATRLTFGLTFLGVILAELFVSNGGLGDELSRALAQVNVERLLAEVLLIGVYALLPNAALRVLEVRLSRRLAVGR